MNTSLEISLADLRNMHPLLPETTAGEYAHRASLGLARHGHPTKVTLQTVFEMTSGTCDLVCTTCQKTDAEMLDDNRITEDCAEAIALAVVNVINGWVVRRRLQRGESGDWLLIDKAGKHVALEVSGTDEGDGAARLADKAKQVAKSNLQIKSAFVVELKPPRALQQTQMSRL